MALQHSTKRQLFPGPWLSLGTNKGQGALKMSSVPIFARTSGFSREIFQKYLCVSGFVSAVTRFVFPYRKLPVWINAYRIGSLISVSALIVNRRTMCILERTNNHECGGLLARC